MDPIPRALVTESGDEVSCSIEETNRIRAALGLRPLDVGTSSKPKEVDVRVDAAKAREAEELKARIERARKEREAAAAGRGKGLGDVLVDGSLSAADWIAHSRKTQAAQLKKGEAVKRTTIGDLDDDEAANSVTGFRARRSAAGSEGAELSGVRIAHSADAFSEGQSVILTLKDSSLLNEKGTGLADAEDELISSEIADVERANESNVRKSLVSKPIYSGHDYEEGKAILSQYDEEANAAARKRAAALVIGSDGVIKPSDDAAAAAERVKTRLAAAAAAKAATAIDLGGSASLRGAEDAPRLASDYYSAAEMAAFASKGGKKGKKKGLRKAAADEADAAAVEPQQEQSVGQAVVPVPDASSERDRGSRAARRGADALAHKSAQEQAALAGQQAAFDSAVAKAEVKSAAAFKDSQNGGAAAGAELPKGWAEAETKPQQPAAPIALGPIPTSTAASNANISDFSRQRVYSRLREVKPASADGDDDEDDADLTAVLARARRLAQQAVQSASSSSSAGGSKKEGSDAGGEAPSVASSAAAGEDRAAQEVAARLAELAKPPATGGDEAMDGSGSTSGGGVVFTETTEFSRLLEGRILAEQEEDEEEESSAMASNSAGATSSSTAAATASSAPSRKRKRWADADDVPGANEESASADAAAAAGASTWTSADGGGNDVEMGDNGDAYGSDEDGDGDYDDDEEGSGGERDDEAADSFTGREPEINKGVAGALALFARTGALQVKQDRYHGRTKDPRPEWDKPSSSSSGGAGASGKGPAHDVKLEYRDKYGNKLTPKEAYRELCYKFHGRMPSQKVRDKRMRKMKREQALDNVSSTDTPLGSLQATLRAQESRGAAYIPLGK